jgi:uncharacterized protein (TIGR02118 family)
VYDVFVLYDRPQDTSVFDEHYRSVHVPLVEAMPLLREFTWAKSRTRRARCTSWPA